MKLEPEAIEAFFDTDTFVPENLRPGLKRYIEDGVPVGSFLEAVLCNDLYKAVFKVDPITFLHLVTVVRWLWNFAPMDCHGSDAKVRGWIEARQHDAHKDDDHDRMRDTPRRSGRTHEQKESSQEKYI